MSDYYYNQNNDTRQRGYGGIIFGIVFGLFVLISGITAVSMYFSYNNQEVALRQQAEAQRGKIEGTFDAMWKIISQQAQVSNEYKDAFKEIYPELISGRYANDNTLMKWVQESNPNFDTSLYKDLMQSIEVNRIQFDKTQQRMLDLIREHETLCNTFPGTWFIKNKAPIEYTIVSSTKTKMTMETGIDDDIELFNK
jgi:hypothetical protein